MEREEHTRKTYQEPSKPEKPLISIITVCYNAASLLERTIKSITAQTFRNIEYIIIDGGSTDGTIDIINKYDECIDHWISEADRGIYDAMNKGLRFATGDYVWFINAGDEIYSHDTLEKISPLFDEMADVYYGEAMYVDAEGREIGLRSEITAHTLPASLTWRDLKRGMVVCHQSFMVKRTLVPFYNLAHEYSSDIDWVIESLKRSRNIINTGTVLSRYLIGGYSKQFHVRSLIDRYVILQKHFGIVPNFVNHVIITLRAAKRTIFGTAGKLFRSDR